MNDAEYPVALITDKNYVIPTAVAIQSLIRSFKRKERLIVCIIFCGVDEKDKRLFQKFTRKNVEIRIIDYDAHNLTQYNEDGYYVTETALVKFCIPRLLPEYDRILYIDGDVLIQRDMTDIFKTDIDGYYAAAVEDMIGVISTGLHKKLGLRRYFNSGVLFLNARKFREDRLEERLFAVKASHPEYWCMDQDVFNDVFSMKVLFLPQKWNLMMPNFFQKMEQSPDFSIHDIDAFFGSSYGSMEAMEQDAYLLHLTNEKKPWIYKNSYMARQWLRMFKRTPFKRRQLLLRIFGEIGHKWVGPFLLRTFINRKDLTFLGIPIVRKEHVSPCTVIWILGIPMLSRIWYEYEIVTRFFYVFRFRKANWYKIENRLDSCLEMMRTSAGSGGYEKAVFSQLERIRGIQR